MGHYISVFCTVGIINVENILGCVLLSKAAVWENDGAHITTAGSSLKSMMWGMDGGERRGCGERYTEGFQCGNKDRDCLIINDLYSLVATLDKENVSEKVQGVLRQMEGPDKEQADKNHSIP